MPSKSDVQIYVPANERITLWFIREGVVTDDAREADELGTPLFWADVRADLTFNEKRRLHDAIRAATDETAATIREENEALPEGERLAEAEIRRRAALQINVERLWDTIAPFVLDWSVGEIIDGTPVKIDPPAVGGGEQFAYISENFTVRIMNHLIVRSEGVVSTDFLGKSRRSATRTAPGAETGTATSD